MTKTVLRHGNQYEVEVSIVGDNEGYRHDVYVIKRRRCTDENGWLTTRPYRQRITSERKIKDVLRNGIYIEEAQ